MEELLFDEEYTGPRYTYGFTNRPPGYGHNPAGYIIHSDRKDDRFRWGTLDWPRPLTAGELYSYELVPANAEARVAACEECSNKECEECRYGIAEGAGEVEL